MPKHFPILLRTLLALVIIGELTYFLVLTFHLQTMLKTPVISDAMPLVIDPPVISKLENVHSALLPVRLKIPKIKVDAPIDSVGLTSEGAMDIPKDRSTTAWFNLGPRPGEKGSAVIDGHFGWRGNLSAVFDDLDTLSQGDKLYVEDEKGETVVFVVRELRTLGRNENASTVFLSTDGKAHLNLITCQGAWSKKQQSYANRLVVFSDKEQ